MANERRKDAAVIDETSAAYKAVDDVTWAQHDLREIVLRSARWFV